MGATWSEIIRANSVLAQAKLEKRIVIDDDDHNICDISSILNGSSIQSKLI